MGSIMSHFGMSWDDVFNKISYQNLVMLSASGPRYKKKGKGDKSEGGKKGVDTFGFLESVLASQEKKPQSGK